MFSIGDITTLIQGAIDLASKKMNDQVVGKLIEIERQVNELYKENHRLQEKLDIRKKMVYDKDARSFTLPEHPNIHYCSVCYGADEKLIPMWDNSGVLVCEKCVQNRKR